MREALFQIKKRLKAFAALQTRRFKRMFVKNRLTPEEAFEIPIVLNNRNRYTYLRNMIDWLREAGYSNIYVLDNESTYPKLLEYYRQAGVTVIYLKKNAGYMALWESDLFKKIGGGYYVYSDPDLEPMPECPRNIVYRLYQVLAKYPYIEKCGTALKMDDIPAHYSRRAEVLDVEGRYWKKKMAPDVYDAPVDTTFALYRPFAQGNAESCRAMRLAGPCTLRHMPWYENSAALDPEAQYYKDASSNSSYWYNPR